MTKENDVTGFPYKPGDRIRRTNWASDRWVEVVPTPPESRFIGRWPEGSLGKHSMYDDDQYGAWEPYVEPVPVVHYEVVLRPPRTGERYFWRETISEAGEDHTLAWPVVVREWNEPQETPR